MVVVAVVRGVSLISCCGYSWEVSYLMIWYVGWWVVVVMGAMRIGWGWAGVVGMGMEWWCIVNVIWEH